MPIQINYSPSMGTIARLSYAAGRGEFNKWKAGLDQRQDIARSQAMLGGFGAGANLGLGIAQLASQQRMATMRRTQAEGVAAANLAQESGRKQAQAPLAQWLGKLQGMPQGPLADQITGGTADDTYRTVIQPGLRAQRAQADLLAQYDPGVVRAQALARINGPLYEDQALQALMNRHEARVSDRVDGGQLSAVDGLALVKHYNANVRSKMTYSRRSPHIAEVAPDHVTEIILRDPDGNVTGTMIAARDPETNRITWSKGSTPGDVELQTAETKAHLSTAKTAEMVAKTKRMQLADDWLKQAEVDMRYKIINNEMPWPREKWETFIPEGSTETINQPIIERSDLIEYIGRRRGQNWLNDLGLGDDGVSGAQPQALDVRPQYPPGSYEDYMQRGTRQEEPGWYTPDIWGGGTNVSPFSGGEPIPTGPAAAPVGVAPPTMMGGPGAFGRQPLLPGVQPPMGGPGAQPQAPDVRPQVAPPGGQPLIDPQAAQQSNQMMSDPDFREGTSKDQGIRQKRARINDHLNHIIQSADAGTPIRNDRGQETTPEQMAQAAKGALQYQQIEKILTMWSKNDPEKIKAIQTSKGPVYQQYMTWLDEARRLMAAGGDNQGRPHFSLRTVAEQAEQRQRGALGELLYDATQAPRLGPPPRVPRRRSVP